MFAEDLKEGFLMYQDNAKLHMVKRKTKKLQWSREHNMKKKLKEEHLNFLKYNLDQED